MAERFFAAGSMVIVDRQDIEQMGADSIGDALRQLPGVQVTGGGNGNLEIRMRGLDPSATRILIDGEQLGGARQGSQLPLDQLPADMIERIEVLRAPTAQYAGATGGTINIVLRQASVKRETHVRLTNQRVWGQDALQGFFSRTGPLSAPPVDLVQSGTKADALTPDAAPFRPPEPWTYLVTGSVYDRLTGSNGHRDTVVTGLNPARSQSDETQRNRNAEWFLVPRISGRLGPVDQLNIRSVLLGNHVNGRFDSAGTGSDSSGATSSRIVDQSASERSFFQLRGDWTRRLSGSRLETSLSGQANREKIERHREQTLASTLGSTLTPSDFLDDRRERAWTLSTKLSGTEDALLWMGGAEAEDRRLNVDTAYGGSLSPTLPFALGARIRRQALWAQNEWELPARTTLTAGLRLENVETMSDYAGLSATDRRRFLQPSLHVRTPIDPQLQLRFNLARVSRNPALLDLLDRRVPSQGVNAPNNPDLAGNPLLRPESSLTLDAGLERQLGTQGQTGLNLFVRQISDVVARRVTDGGTLRWTQRPENVGNATAWGVEGDVKTALGWPGALDWGRDWTVSANASLLQSRMTSGDSLGQRIPGQARYLASLNIARPTPKMAGWYGGSALSLTGPADLNSAPGSSGRDRASLSLDAHIGQVVADMGYWRLTVYNLSNARRVRERSDTDASGRVYTEQSSLRWTPRIFLTLGTRF